MDTFFTYLKKSLVATIFIIFGFVTTYIPQPYNHVPKVEAGGLSGGAVLPMQIVQNASALAGNVQSTISAVADGTTAISTNSLLIKETLLDGIGWALAKRIVSMMVSSLIDWINSGFQGSPAFVQDLQGFLLQAADETFGEYISELGGIFDFVCSPFQLDVQVSLAMQYQQTRGSDGQSAPTCTLSGVINNIEGFIAGNFDAGGWDDWFDITATPQVYTPYGSMLTAQAGLRAALVNAQGEEIKLLEFGDGFLSGEICELVHGGGAPKEECFVSKPGKIIQEALTFNLDSGRQSLIQADEFNEVIAALLGQLANTVLTGASGLLGLSSGTGFTYSGFDGGAFVNEVVTSASQNFDFARAGRILTDALAVQEEYRDLASLEHGQLSAVENSVLYSVPRRDAATAARLETERVIIDTQGAFPAPSTPTPASSIQILNDFINEYDNSATTPERRLQIMDQYTLLELYAVQEVRASAAAWANARRAP